MSGHLTPRSTKFKSHPTAINSQLLDELQMNKLCIRTEISSLCLGLDSWLSTDIYKPHEAVFKVWLMSSTWYSSELFKCDCGHTGFRHKLNVLVQTGNSLQTTRFKCTIWIEIAFRLNVSSESGEYTVFPFVKWAFSISNHWQASMDKSFPQHAFSSKRFSRIFCWVWCAWKL